MLAYIAYRGSPASYLIATIASHFLAILYLVLLSTSSAQADFKDAVVAYDNGSYKKALNEFSQLAEGSHSGAEFMLGAMYFYGKGVKPNHKMAAIWFYKSASKGNPNAQLAIGSLHIRGIGVRQNLIDAYSWLTITINSNVPGLRKQATKLRESTRRLMGIDEIEEAEGIADSFTSKKSGLTYQN